jgi:tetratricopeptide (TPR) repeat protein
LTDRFELAEEYYRRCDALRHNLPGNFQDSADGLASHAGSLTNQAILAGYRGQHDRAIELLKASIPSHKATLAQWPTNPVAIDCYYTCLGNIAEFQLDTGHDAEAAAAVENCIREFPDRLEAYHVGAEQLLRCADMAEGQAAAAYRQRAHELVAQSANCKTSRPDMAGSFAWFLLTSEDTSFRDADRALKMAEAVVNDVPERSDAWLTLALAHYRLSNWSAADDALQDSIDLSPDGRPTSNHWLLGSMIHWQSGRQDEARQRFAEYQKSEQRGESHHELAAEAAALIKQTGED